MAKSIKYKTLSKIADRFRADLKDLDFLLLYAYNGTGKTRLSMEFKDKGKKKGKRDTLYFNAFTEDLYHWDNDLDNDTERVLKINDKSVFFDGFKELSLEEKIFPYLERYAEFNFKIDYDDFAKCIHGVNDDILYARALNLLSHGKYSIYEPVDMGDDNKKLFSDILEAFLTKYEFDIPEILTTKTAVAK